MQIDLGTRRASSTTLRTRVRDSLVYVYIRTVVALPSSVVKCLWEVFVWGFGALFLSCVCVCVAGVVLCWCVCVWPVDLLTYIGVYPLYVLISRVTQIDLGTRRASSTTSGTRVSYLVTYVYVYFKCVGVYPVYILISRVSPHIRVKEPLCA